MVAKRYIPDSGDLVWINFDPTKGHEQNNTRPAIVLSPKKYSQKTSLAVVCPVTSQGKGYPFEVLLETKRISGVILSDQIRTIDWKARPVKFVCRSPKGTLEQVRAKIQKLIF